jgi:hypothetical protein
MKAVRDYLRAAADLSKAGNKMGATVEKSPNLAFWPEAKINVIYMMFLGFESARRAIADLVEYEPRKAEVTIGILISELEAYRFLLGKFTDLQDMRYQRIHLRYPDYELLVPGLLKEVEAKKDFQKWKPPFALLPELLRRYEAVCSEYTIRAASPIG